MAVPLKDTIQDMRSVESAIKASAEKMRRQPLTVQELVDAVDSSLKRVDTLLKDEPDLNENSQKSLDELLECLHDIERHLQDRRVYGFRARFLRRLEGIFIRRRDLCAPHRLALKSAVENLKASLSSGDAPAVLLAVPSAVPAVEPKKQSRKLDTVVDAIEIGLHAVSHAADLIPPPGSAIVKLMAGTGITIIDLLNGISDNREEALALGRHVGVLVQTVVSFLEASASGQQEPVDEATQHQLSAFLGALKSVESSIERLRAQSDLKQGVSHKSNKADLQNLDTEVKRAFDQLQNRLSLHSLRVLTKMNAADARLERVRLLDRLGDGATGATSKAEDEADLMCHPQTRRAVLDDIDRWVKDPLGERILWISGVAGCGKSAVTATIPHHRTPTSSATFYFNRGTQEHNQRVICSLSRQLADLGYGVPERVVLEAVDAQPNIATSHLTTQFQHLLVNSLRRLVPGSPPVLILMDGLDEWENHDAACKLVELIGNVHSELPSTVRFVIASRNESYIVTSMRKAKVLPLVKRYELDKVPREDALNDVRAYLDRRFTVIRSNSTDPITSKKNWPKKNDMNVLVDLSGGLFQWAATVMKYIEQRQANTRLRRILDAPEEFRGLDGLYGGIFQSSIEADTPPSVLQLLQKVLGLIVVAPIPVDAVTITELCADPSKKETLEDIEEDVLARLASFLILPKDKSEPIRVSHKSAVDFITNAERCTDSRFFIRTTDHHQRLASICLPLLNQNLTHNLSKISNRKISNKQAQDQQLLDHISPTLRYACRYWATHLSLASHNSAAELSKLLDEFTGDVLMYWAEVMSLCGFTSERQAVLAVEDALSWSSACAPPTLPIPTIQALLSDMMHLLDMFERPIAERAGLIYACALPLASSILELRRRYSEAGAKGLRTIRGPQYTPTTKSFWVAKEFPEIVSMSTEGNMFASTTRHNHAIFLWDGITGEPRGKPLKGHTGAVTCVAFTTDGKSLASASSDGTVRIWDIGTGSQKGRALEVGEQNSVVSITPSPGAQTLALGFESGEFHLVGLEYVGRWILWLDCGGSWLAPSQASWASEEVLESASQMALQVQGVVQQLGQELARVQQQVQKQLQEMVKVQEVVKRRARDWEVQVRQEMQERRELLEQLGQLEREQQLEQQLKQRQEQLEQERQEQEQRQEQLLQELQEQQQQAELQLQQLQEQAELELELEPQPQPPQPQPRLRSRLLEPRRLQREWQEREQIRKQELQHAREQELNQKQTLRQSQELQKTLSRDLEQERQWAQVLERVLEHGRVGRRHVPPNPSQMRQDLEQAFEHLVRLMQLDLETRLVQIQTPSAQAEVRPVPNAWSGRIQHQEHHPCIVGFSSDGNTLGYLAGGTSIRLWNVDSRREIKGVRQGNQESVTGLAFLPNGSTKLALGDERGAMHIWDAETGKSRAITSRAQGRRGPVQTLQFSADSKVLASYSTEESLIQLSDLEGQTRGQRGEPLRGYAGQASIVAFSYGARMLACGHVERTWDLDTEVERGESVLKGHTSLVLCLAFSPDGRMLSSGSIDGAICLWNPQNGAQTGQITSGQGGLPMALHFINNGSKLVASHGVRAAGPEDGATDPLQSGEIDRDGWVLHGTFRWFWLPICGGEWVLHGTCLAVRTGFCVFIFDVSGVMDMIS